jgi:hypothetical protein
MKATHGVWADWSDGGGAKIHTPGASGPVPYGVATGALRPSPARRASMSAAAARPTATPAALPASGRAASEASYRACSAPPGSPR